MNIKTIIVCASALVFSLCGCDSGNSAAIATGPRAADGAFISAGVDKASFDKVLGENKDKFYAELKDILPEDFKESMTKAELDDVEIKWGGVSICDMEFDENGMPKDKMPDMIYALAFDHDFDKIAAAIKEEVKNGRPKLKDATFLGEKGLVITDEKLTIAIASISGKILVAGTSEAGAEKAVALYRDGKGGESLSTGADSVFKAFVKSIGERMLKWKIPVENFEGMLGEGVDVPAILHGLKDANISVSATNDNGAEIYVKVETASASDAKNVVDFLNKQLDSYKAEMAAIMLALSQESDSDAKAALDALNGITIKADGATISATLNHLRDAKIFWRHNQ